MKEKQNLILQVTAAVVAVLEAVAVAAVVMTLTHPVTIQMMKIRRQAKLMLRRKFLIVIVVMRIEVLPLTSYVCNALYPKYSSSY